MGAAAGGAFVALAVTWRLTVGLASIRFRRDAAVWRGLLSAALPLGLALAINALYFRADTLIISLYEPYGQVGLYTLAYRMLELALVVGTVFLNTTFPLLSDAVANDEPRALRTIQLSTDLFVIMGVPLVAGGLLLAPEIVELAAGEEFVGAAEPLRILLVAGALAWVNGVFGFALIAKERQASALWLNGTALAFNLGLNFLLIPRYGIVVAAIVTVASEILILAGSYLLMRRHFKFFPAARALPAALLAAGIMSGMLWLLRGAPLGVAGARGGALQRTGLGDQPTWAERAGGPAPVSVGGSGARGRIQQRGPAVRDRVHQHGLPRGPACPHPQLEARPGQARAVALLQIGPREGGGLAPRKRSPENTRTRSAACGGRVVPAQPSAPTSASSADAFSTAPSTAERLIGYRLPWLSTIASDPPRREIRYSSAPPWSDWSRRPAPWPVTANA